MAGNDASARTRPVGISRILDMNNAHGGSTSLAYLAAKLGAADGSASRARFWAQLLPDAPPVVADFDEEEARYAQAAEAARHGTAFVWTGAHGSSQLWLQRLCAMFSPQADVRLVEAVDPGAASGGRRALSQFDPGEFGELLARVRALDGGEIARLAGEWRRNSAIPSGVRRWADGRITHHGGRLLRRSAAHSVR